MSEKIVASSGQECINNMLCISFSDKQLKSITKGDLVDFIKLIMSNRTEQVKELGIKMIFYFWHDQQAGQLSFSLILGNNPLLLPFGCKVIQVNDIHEIIESYLSEPGGFIPFTELVEVPIDEIDHIKEKEFELKVYSIAID